MMEQVLKMLHAEDKLVLSRLAYSKGTANDLDAYVSNNPQDLRNALEIDTDIYIERNTSTSTKISMLRKFFKAYGANEEDLMFYLKDMNDDGTAQEAGTGYELRRRYWAFALPYIQQAHDDGNGHGCFSGCTTSKENWLRGFFGIGGFSLVCVANYNKARVDLSLSHSNKERNKEAFDYLYRYKSEIELFWERRSVGCAVMILRVHISRFVWKMSALKTKPTGCRWRNSMQNGARSSTMYLFLI